jgi:regulatory protein
LVDERLLDDGRFAEAYIHYRVGRGYGPVRIGAELRQRGVADALTAALLDRLEIDWDEHIAAVWGKKFGRAAADFRERAKQARFLQYRGFAPDQIARILDAKYRQTR